MKKITHLYKTCTKCGLEQALEQFPLGANAKISDICVTCRSTQENEDYEETSGGVGKKLHKDFYSETRPDGEKGENTLKELEHQHEKRQKFDLFKKQEVHKQSKMAGFLEKIRGGSELFSKPKTTTKTPGASKQSDASNVANDAQTEHLTTNSNAIDPTSERVKYKWTKEAIQSQVNRGHINPLFTFHRKSLQGFMSEKSTGQTGEKPQAGLPDDDPVKKVIKSWGPGKN